MPKSTSAAYERVLKKLREICLELPDTTETLSWGKPHFRVANKIFCGCREEDGRIVIGLQLEMGHAQQIVEDPRFWLVGGNGGVCMDATDAKDWEQIKALVKESHHIFSSKKKGDKAAQATRKSNHAAMKSNAATRKSNRTTTKLNPATTKSNQTSRKSIQSRPD